LRICPAESLSDGQKPVFRKDYLAVRNLFFGKITWRSEACFPERLSGGQKSVFLKDYLAVKKPVPSWMFLSREGRAF
jgi:phosphoribosylaminoimidazole (AIR) synthetase